jgi:hypothetical protein
LKTAELFDPESGTFEATGPMRALHLFHAAAPVR